MESHNCNTEHSHGIMEDLLPYLAYLTLAMLDKTKYYMRSCYSNPCAYRAHILGYLSVPVCPF